MILLDLPLEPLTMRYTTQWAKWFSAAFTKAGFDFDTVRGPPLSRDIKAGAFLDAYNTNIWGLTQIARTLEIISDNPYAEYTVFMHDLWQPGLEALAYAKLMGRAKIRITGYLHAGAYDPTDILAVQAYAQNESWPSRFEKMLADVVDDVFVGSLLHAHRLRHLLSPHVVGNPVDTGGFTACNARTSTVVFPHRLTSDKQPQLFDAAMDIVRRTHPHVSVVKTYEHKLPKDEYYKLLSTAAVAVSCAHHENFGIAMVEAAALGCYPVVPDRLAYRETMPDFTRYGEDSAPLIAKRIMAGLYAAQHGPFGYSNPFTPQRVTRRVVDVLRSK